jgi:TonB family protein
VVIFLKANNTGLTRFLLLSIGLHALFIVAWQPGKQAQVSLIEASSPLMVNLAAAPEQPALPQQSITRTPQNRPGHRQTATRTRPVSNNPVSNYKATTRLTTNKPQKHIDQGPPRATVAVQTRTPQPEKTIARSTVPSASHDQRQRLGARIQKQLGMKLAFNRHYPGMAIRNAWEGQVRLGIRVLANGNLTNIHVINSSGYRILDKAAVKSVRHIAALPEAGPWLQGQSIDVILPVIYKLIDS